MAIDLRRAHGRRGDLDEGRGPAADERSDWVVLEDWGPGRGELRCGSTSCIGSSSASGRRPREPSTRPPCPAARATPQPAAVRGALELFAAVDGLDARGACGDLCIVGSGSARELRRGLLRRVRRARPPPRPRRLPPARLLHGRRLAARPGAGPGRGGRARRPHQRHGPRRPPASATRSASCAARRSSSTSSSSTTPPDRRAGDHRRRPDLVETRACCPLPMPSASPGPRRRRRGPPRPDRRLLMLGPESRPTRPRSTSAPGSGRHLLAGGVGGAPAGGAVRGARRAGVVPPGVEPLRWAAPSPPRGRRRHPHAREQRGTDQPGRHPPAAAPSRPPAVPRPVHRRPPRVRQPLSRSREVRLGRWSTGSTAPFSPTWRPGRASTCASASSSTVWARTSRR